MQIPLRLHYFIDSIKICIERSDWVVTSISTFQTLSIYKVYIHEVYILTIPKRFVWQLTPNRHVTETVLEISIITISRLLSITFSASIPLLDGVQTSKAWEISKFQCTNPQEGRYVRDVRVIGVKRYGRFPGIHHQIEREIHFGKL